MDDGLRDSTNLVDHTGPQPLVVPWEPNETWFEANFRYYYKSYTWREGIEFLQRNDNTSWWMVVKENIEGQVIMKGKGGGYSNAFSDQSKTLWRLLLVKIVLWKYLKKNIFDNNNKIKRFFREMENYYNSKFQAFLSIIWTA